MLKIALAGNPNCGKTTLFNQLTGSNQYVGNWAGVTVEKKEGSFKHKNMSINVVDLPGIYSLSPYTLEEVVSRDFIIESSPDVIVNIIDGTNIERNLYLTIQLMELGRPVVLAVNMMDDVESRGDKINLNKLSELLNIPVVGIVARSNKGLSELIEKTISSANTINTNSISYDAYTQKALSDIKEILKHKNSKAPIDFYAGKLLEGDYSQKSLFSLTDNDLSSIDNIAARYEETRKLGDRETLLADARYTYITNVTGICVNKNHKPGTMTLSDKIDSVLTHRIFAIPAFLLIMLTMFSLTFSPITEGMKAIIEYFVNDIVSPGVLGFLYSANAPAWTIGLIVDGVIGGVGGILTFLPQIMILFLFLSILEDSGYMARAAFIMDRLLRKLGLTGKSFIPMLMGFGCTTPAVMAARTMENEKDRRLTIMLTPFMSCGARLPIYALFASAFFTEYQGLVVFSMYILGMVVAIVCGLFLKNTLFRGETAPFIMELPTYRLPTAKSVALHMWDKCKGFLVKAGTIILSMSVIIWILQNFDMSLNMVEQTSDSIFAAFGGLIAPLFVPLGFGTWQASVSILTGLVAKEAVVSTMMVLYGAATEAQLSVVLGGLFTPASALAFMTFTLLYMPCISAFVSIKREMNSTKWAVGTAVFETLVAYVVAWLVYIIANLFI